MSARFVVKLQDGKVVGLFQNKMDAKKARNTINLDGKFQARVSRGPDHPRGPSRG